MHINFESLRFRNVLSYGNKWSEFVFEPGLNLIRASNGSGKSAILDAINYGLFGKPFRNIKIGQLVNKYNKKNMVVNVKFSIGQNHYEITRGYKPDIFNLNINGNDVENMASKRLNQEEIEKLIGINEKLFKYIVGIAVTNSKPFCTMSVGDKRALIESTFNIDVLSSMAKEVKRRNTINESDLRIKLTENNGLQNSIKDNEEYIVKIQKYIEQFDENKKATCEELASTIKQFEAAIAQQQANIKKGNAAVERQATKQTLPSSEETYRVNADIGAAEHSKKLIEKNLREVGTGALCPLCGSELDSGHAAEHIKELKAELKALTETKLPSLYAEQTKLAEQKQAYDEIQSKIFLIKQKVLAEEVKMNSNTSQLEKFKVQLTNEQNKQCDFSTAEYETKLAKLKTDAASLAKDISETEHKIKIDNKLSEILGDEGLRMYFFKKLLPILNSRINYYLKKFELPATLELDSSMQEKIMTGRFEQAYQQFSAGERARIDMAILLSFFDISKMISNWSCSLLFVDEVLDNGVDNSGTEQFLSTFYSIVTEQDKNVGIYIISHKLSDIQINWSNVIEIRKKSMFSEIVKAG